MSNTRLVEQRGRPLTPDAGRGGLTKQSAARQLLGRVIIRQRWPLILVWTFIIMLTLPVAERWWDTRLVFWPMVMLGGCAAAASARRQRRLVQCVLVLAALWICAEIPSLVWGLRGYRIASQVLGFAVMCLMFAIVRREVDRAADITLDVIAQALVGYLLIGIAWMAIYAVANLIDGRIFAPPLRSDQMASFEYFSFSTLTSLGSGDITPVDPFIRMVAVTETILGIFYNATVIARLVALYRPR
jgi:voltage-gated potassium channel